MKARWFAAAAVLLVVGILAFMVFTPAVNASMDGSVATRARERGWVPVGEDESHVGPMSLVRVHTREMERKDGGVLVGKFYSVSVKSPVWLPEATLESFVDAYLRDLAADSGVTLTRVQSSPDARAPVVLEYRGAPTSGSLFGSQDVGVLARVMPCDVAGNVVIAAGFGSVKTPTGGLFGSSTNVYLEDVKGVLAPAVSCP